MGRPQIPGPVRLGLEIDAAVGRTLLLSLPSLIIMLSPV
jgi:hypothetical protein